MLKRLRNNVHYGIFKEIQRALEYGSHKTPLPYKERYVYN